MSQNDGTGDFWDETAPADADFEFLGPKEIRDVRKGTRIRLAKEHVTPASADVGGEHLMGSAICYYGGTFPAFKPDGVTALDSADNGRVWINSANGVISTWVGSQWFFTTLQSSDQLGNGIVISRTIADGAVGTAQLAGGAVTEAKLASASVGTAELIDSSVTIAKVAVNAIGTANIADGAVTAAKLANIFTQMTTGTYTGNNGTSTITVGFQPDVVYIYDGDSNAVVSAVYPGNNNPTRLRADNVDLGTFNSSNGITFLANGFSVTGTSPYFNNAGNVFYWVAWKKSQ